jgi:site-specific DNA recombinase
MDAQYTRRDESKLLLSVTGAAAEAYRDEISRRTRRGLEGRARAALPAGGRAYGYVAGKDPPSGQMKVHPAQAETVRRIFQWFADGKSPRWIAGELNRLEVPSPDAAWRRT